MTVKEIEAAAPPVPALESLRRNLLYAMLKGVKDDDMTAIVAKQVEMAKDGDHKSARLVIDMVQMGNEQRAVNMSQNVLVHNDKTTVFMSDLRRNLVVMIASSGPKRPEKIVKDLHTPIGRVLEAVRHPWFEEGRDGIHITPQARAEVLCEEA